MAATKKAGGASAQKAAADYRAALVDNSIEELVGDLAVKMGEWTQSRELRESETAKLIAAEEAAEEAVVAAYDAAKDAGAKVKALEKINLKPVAAIAAVGKRAKANAGTATRPEAVRDAPAPSSVAAPEISASPVSADPVDSLRPSPAEVNA
ncbi:hypothetical protein OPAG_08379 [Rhodococcus opacus PD630]|uniref:hypothetical protein n=1 Tax=Rhodococcus opacus TaxID=37919 RepID=UPI00029CD278|nr:hypothetical protein [Rhodococcus opacus]AHK35495.1 hypothetical protein Pd630_LPD10045 [Rhodococcus opacus PD630]EHI39078.1 hypothetical protein OPAG_08379 [Rhodococcus opacus PD630]UDH01760.1 hypothetical protein K2Z90_008220 [Rhodococcus opacus PD630]